MFSHIMLGSDDIEQSKRFYDAVMQELGYPAGVIDAKGRIAYSGNGGRFMITKPINGEKATYGNGMTIGFAATSEEQVNAWHAAGIANGGTTCENPPGLRVNGTRQLYLAYLRDPFGNKLCAAYVLSA
ncbi:VOC family protein [Vibrio tritonius]|uniref:VOC family protein n=1 Tax=Vibrio tritonius TaxID=1435069 RepID=A0ABS7YM19_9VIBR|nr:VOC family protein [Vibrio tritonius]MCA2016725.1 VOC family protein [Vibrio tritonius]